MPNESPYGSSPLGDGIYWLDYDQEEGYDSESPLAVRKRLLNEYLRSCIGDQGHEGCCCHFNFETSDLKLSDEKLEGYHTKTHRSNDDELRIGSPRVKHQEQLKYQRLQADKTSKRNWQTDERQHQERGQRQQQVASVTRVTREGSAFASLICAPGESCATNSQLERAQRRGKRSRQQVARHHQRKPLVSANTQNHYGISERPDRRASGERLFIDDESVQSSSASQARGCCRCSCLAEISDAGREIYEQPRSGAAGPSAEAVAAAAAASSASCCQRARVSSWPCYCSSRASVKQAHRNCTAQPEARGFSDSEARLAWQGEPLHYGALAERLARSSAHPNESAQTTTATTTTTTPSDDEDSDDLDKFDIRSALDCVEEFSPIWSDLSSAQIGDSAQDQLPALVGAAAPGHTRQWASPSGQTETPASWIELQKMELDDWPTSTTNKRELNNNDCERATLGRHISGRPRSNDLSDPLALGRGFEEFVTRAPREEDRKGGAVKYYLAQDENHCELTKETDANRGARSGIDDAKRRTVSQRKRRRKKKKKEKGESEDLRETEKQERADSGEVPLATDELRASARANQSASMRAARDLAKLSVPSLSSLQYLPGQLDARPAKMVDRKASARSRSASRASLASPKGLTGDRRANVNTGLGPRELDDGAQSISAHVEEENSASASGLHDESCLFDRLCLCNCMASKRAKSDEAKQTSREASPVGGGGGSSSSAGPSPARARSSSKSSRASRQARASPVSLSESVDLRYEDISLASVDSSHGDCERNGEPSEAAAAARAASSPHQDSASRSGGNVVMVREDAPPSQPRFASASNMPREKQSPTFLGLLKPWPQLPRRSATAAHATSGVVGKLRGHPVGARGLTLGAKCSERFTASSRVPGSIDDLETSGRSSSSAASGSRATSDFCSPTSSRSSGPSPQAAATASPFDKSNFKTTDAPASEEAGGAESGRPCDNRHARTCRSRKFEATASLEGPARRRPVYKRLLSPGKLFASSSHSNLCQDCSPPTNVANGQKSFLSRSLGRLSGRSSRRGASPRPASNNKQQETEESEQQSARPPRVASAQHQQDSCPFDESTDSLEEINLCHSLPYEVNRELSGICEPSKSSTRLLSTPEIVLSHVEYRDTCELSGSSACSSDRMTRSTGGGGLGQPRHHLRVDGRRSSGRNQDYQIYERTLPPQRHGSEISFGTSASEMSGASLAHGPFSLPASPRASRRTQSGSPRLSHSPVPFHSPASESTKIEDGLRVCSTGHFEKHIGNIKGGQIEAQRRLFTAWINHYAPNLIARDLFAELQDGIKLIGLLASLTHDRRLMAEYERLSRDRRTYVNRLALTPSSRLTHISNVHIAIEYMRTSLGMKLVNLNPMDIVSGKENVILGLCWNIILHFQLGRGLLSPAGSSRSHSPCSEASSSVLRTQRPVPPGRAQTSGARELVDELSSRDLGAARSKLLAHINKRFNLKLTNLTSSLVDGDVLLAIIWQLVPPTGGLHGDSRVSAAWLALQGDEEKLELCFQLAQDYLNVPRLISASDLKRETICEKNSKPLLVYLSMLLKANPRDCSTDQMLELRQLDQSLRGLEQRHGQQPKQQRQQDEPAPPKGPSETIKSLLEALNSSDIFHMDKLQDSLDKIAQVEELLKKFTGREEQGGVADARELKIQAESRAAQLRQQAEQVDALIAWINQADKLFEAKQEASSDLARATDLRERSALFFSPANLPTNLDTSLCPTLGRQYRECLASARQHILSLEQIIKNWTSHRQASKELKDWLMLAELKLESALRPHGHNAGLLGQEEKLEFGSDEHIEQQKSRLDDLIEFFELEQVDVDELDGPSSNPFGSAYAFNLPLPDGCSSSLSAATLDPGDHSLSGSLLSLASTSSRVSTLASSKRAAHHRLLGNLELQSRLLAAMLEPEERDSISMGVRAFKLRMKQILEHKVPQVVGDLCLSISRCQMQIKEQDELPIEPELDEPEESLDAVTARKIREIEEVPEANGLVADSSDGPSKSDVAPEVEPTSISDEISESLANSYLSQSDHQDETPSPKSARQRRRAQAQSRNNTKRNLSKVNTQTKGARIAQTKPKDCTDDDDNNECEPFYRLLWDKILRATKMSMSFNIVLLICLAGICVVPLIQKDACCELNQASIQTAQYTFSQRPT